MCWHGERGKMTHSIALLNRYALLFNCQFALRLFDAEGSKQFGAVQPALLTRGVTLKRLFDPQPYLSLPWLLNIFCTGRDR